MKMVDNVSANEPTSKEKRIPGVKTIDLPGLTEDTVTEPFSIVVPAGKTYKVKITCQIDDVTE